MDVIVIVNFHFYVLIRPEILFSGTRSTFAAYTTLLNMYYWYHIHIVEVATGDLRSKQYPMVGRWNVTSLGVCHLIQSECWC